MQDKKDSKLSDLTHFDTSGHAHMVDVGDKAATKRIAIATGLIKMQPATLAVILTGSAKKGDVLGIARIAAVMAAKRTPDLIPLCHPIAISKVSIDWEIVESASCIQCKAEVHTQGQTGVEMEALTAVQIGLLTIYDMCKSIDRGMSISDVQLMHKSGGKSSDWSR